MKKEGEKGTRRASDKVYFALEGRTWRLDGGLWPQERAIVSPRKSISCPTPCALTFYVETGTFHPVFYLLL